MTSEQQMSYEPAVGDKVRFLMDTYDYSENERSCAKAEEIGTVAIVAERRFRVDFERGERFFYIWLSTGATKNIPHDLMRIECIEAVPTPCSNQVDVDAVMRRCGDKPSCHDVELKILTVMEMCRELRRYRLEEKERAEGGE